MLQKNLVLIILPIYSCWPEYWKHLCNTHYQIHKN